MLARSVLTVSFMKNQSSLSANLILRAVVPMLMMVGISPELTQAAYRIGDSVTNIITPLNPYLIIILVYVQKYVPEAGMGTLISAMVPYSLIFLLVWTIQLAIWMLAGWPLGIGGPLEYVPG